MVDICTGRYVHRSPHSPSSPGGKSGGGVATTFEGATDVWQRSGGRRDDGSSFTSNSTWGRSPAAKRGGGGGGGEEGDESTEQETANDHVQDSEALLDGRVRSHPAMVIPPVSTKPCKLGSRKVSGEYTAATCCCFLFLHVALFVSPVRV